MGSIKNNHIKSYKMKKLSLVLLVFMALVSCKSEAQVDCAIVSGKITNLTSAQITIATTDGDYENKINLDENGSFEEALELKAGLYYIFDESQNRTPMHLDKGVNINVVYDSKEYKNTIKISGKGVETSKYLLAKDQRMLDFFNDKSDNPYDLEPADFKVKMQAFKKNHENLLLSAKGIPSDYKVLEKRDIHCTYLTMLNQYSWGPKKDSLPADFLSEVDDFDLNNEADYKFSFMYRIYLTNYVNRKAWDVQESGAAAKDMGVFNVVQEFTNDYIKNTLLFDKTSSDIVRTPDIDTYYKTFMSVSTDDAHRKEMTKIYKELKALSKGQASPKFIAYENVNGGTTSLDDLKGKYVFIDLWATWCAPCVKELPFLKKLEEEYHGKNIEFVGISLNDQKDHDRWKKLIQKKGLKGIQLLSDKAMESDFAKAYKVFTIPRFIVLDPDGNIVTSNAPFPSDPKLKELLNGLSL